MRYLFLICLLFPSCAFRAYYPNGKIAAADYTDFEGTTEVRTKGFYMKRTGRQDASTPTRTFVDGAGKIILSGGMAGAGALIP